MTAEAKIKLSQWCREKGCMKGPSYHRVPDLDKAILILIQRFYSEQMR